MDHKDGRFGHQTPLTTPQPGPCLVHSRASPCRKPQRQSGF